MHLTGRQLECQVCIIFNFHPSLCVSWFSVLRNNMLQNLTTIEVLSLLMLNNELVISVLMDHSSTRTDLASRQVGGVN